MRDLDNYSNRFLTNKFKHNGVFTLLPVLTVLAISALSPCDYPAADSSSFRHFRSDSSFVLLTDSTAPDGNRKYFEYYFDIGAFGYSRLFWPVVALKDTNGDLSKGLLPDGYKAVGWTANNELVIEEWTPSYFKSDSVNLKSGEQLHGTTIVVK